MKESPEPPSSLFIFPYINAEHGEFERVSKTLNMTVSVLRSAAEKGELTLLDENVWKILENTDSYDIALGDWETVAERSSKIQRDWQSIKEKIDTGTPIDAPIVLQYGDRYHLVSGNTRLMIVRALGIQPEILLFRVDVD